jgi:hypothetical protein
VPTFALIERSILLETIPAIVSFVGRWVVLEAVPILGRIAMSTVETTAYIARVVAVVVDDALATEEAQGLGKLYECITMAVVYADGMMAVSDTNADESTIKWAGGAPLTGQ